MNKFQVFIDENKDILNDFAKKYIEKTDMPELLKKSISYSLVNDGKKIRPLSFLYLLMNTSTSEPLTTEFARFLSTI